MINIIVSACLLGVNCRYDGGNKYNPLVSALAADPRFKVISICPERMGGLSAPRQPSELRDGHVFSRTCEDVTAEFERGAIKVLELARHHDCKYALLKEHSPSCGHGRIYDGSFTGKLIDGDGVSVALLIKNGITVFGESQINEIFSLIDSY
jgi:Uncharacterized conserved protein